MADLLIRGMEMPEYCIYCPFMISRDNDDCILQSEEANASFENWEQMKAGCPLVELPDHGRLIDADALVTMAREYGYELVSVDRIIAAQTIIPASKEGGE